MRKVGFGKYTVGGHLDYFVSTSYDTGEIGSIRYGLESSLPLRIIIPEDIQDVTFIDKVKVSPNKTIKGLGYTSIQNGYGLSLSNTSNIIIKNLYFRNLIGDGINITYGSQNVYVKNCHFSECADGALDVVRGSTNVTIDSCYFQDQDKVMLVGGGLPENEKTRVTLYQNTFDHTFQRHPKIMRASVHAVANYFHNCRFYSILCGAEAKLFAENNLFVVKPGADVIRYNSDIKGEPAEKGYSKLKNNKVVIHPLGHLGVKFWKMDIGKYYPFSRKPNMVPDFKI